MWITVTFSSPITLQEFCQDVVVRREDKWYHWTFHSFWMKSHSLFLYFFLLFCRRRSVLCESWSPRSLPWRRRKSSYRPSARSRSSRGPSSSWRPRTCRTSWQATVNRGYGSLPSASLCTRDAAPTTLPPPPTPSVYIEKDGSFSFHPLCSPLLLIAKSGTVAVVFKNSNLLWSSQFCRFLLINGSIMLSIKCFSVITRAQSDLKITVI